MRLFVAERRHYERQMEAGTGGSRALCAFNRINALSCIKSAEHGWIGASYSVAELLTSLYFTAGVRNIVLSKGHAAAMQYACLYGLGMIDSGQLLSYKDGPGALQAHTDRTTPGILVNTGSLGQALSKVCGIAACRPEERFAVVLGDGELQEGQVFEGLQTLAHRKLCNVTAIVDRNGFQSALRVEAVKRIADLRRVGEGFGLEVMEIDGHAPAEILRAWAARADRPRLVIARTVKGGGSRYLAPEGERQIWHGRVPDDELYARIVEEQVETAGDPALADDWRAQRSARPAARRAAVAAPHVQVPSTRDAFAARLSELVARDPRIAVLDADLAHACGIEALTAHPRFYEMGISEQDMVSFAGGLALAGSLPVVNTYAAFLKRAYEQIYVNASEGTKIVYAGHYAGLCYHTDGKTHQSINDLSLMLSVPGLVVMEPVTAAQTVMMLDWALGPQPAPVYLRLRRTPAALELPAQELRIERPLARGRDFRCCFVTAGTVSTALALECLRDPRFSAFGLIVQSVLRGPVDRAWYAAHLRDTQLVVTIEEDLAPGALRSSVAVLLAELGIRPRIVGKTIAGFGASFRTQANCLSYFGYTVDCIAALLGDVDPLPPILTGGNEHAM